MAFAVLFFVYLFIVLWQITQIIKDAIKIHSQRAKSTSKSNVGHTIDSENVSMSESNHQSTKQPCRSGQKRTAEQVYRKHYFWF